MEWPIYKWTPDGRYAFFNEANKIVLVAGRKLLEPALMDIEESRVSSFSVNDSCTDETKSAVAIFKAYSPEEQIMASAVLIQVDLQRKRMRRVEQNLGRADECTFQWNRDRLLLTTTKLVDEKGENYGSVTDCFLMTMTSFQQVNTRIVQDAVWNPVKDEIVLIEGKAPCKVTMLRGSDLSVMHSFPSGYRNTVKWNHQGNMLAIGGFGNMAGDLSLWYTGGPTPVRVAEWREECAVVCEWSPCDTYLVTASTFPRMKVDNFMRLYNYEGHLLVSKLLDELCEVVWTKGSGTYPPLTPPEVNQAKQPVERQLFKRRENVRELDARLTTPATRYPKAKPKTAVTSASQPTFTRMGGETKKTTSGSDEDAIERPKPKAKGKAKAKTKARGKEPAKKPDEIHVKTMGEINSEKPELDSSPQSPPSEREFPPLPEKHPATISPWAAQLADGKSTDVAEALRKMASLFETLQTRPPGLPGQLGTQSQCLAQRAPAMPQAIQQVIPQVMPQASNPSCWQKPSYSMSSLMNPVSSGPYAQRAPSQPQEGDLRDRLLRMMQRPDLQHSDMRSEDRNPADLFSRRQTDDSYAQQSEMARQALHFEQLRARERLLSMQQEPLKHAMSAPAQFPSMQERVLQEARRMHRLEMQQQQQQQQQQDIQQLIGGRREDQLDLAQMETLMRLVAKRHPS
ncbi:MAG: uncharacterized protein KVP18_003024 [Porospora cf. gigantea A]|uniref:uncharacterized protein n=1 Tax=Porospora cf. gigantea A TaxID=2853593 RepID=UPI00355AAD17|nr:MAG: hypothetical protein KVP18_003024 [Porospora cf. gigantea A]